MITAFRQQLFALRANLQGGSNIAENDREETALSESVMRYPMLQKKTSDPIAARLIRISGFD
jgi:hypothetical protein